MCVVGTGCQIVSIMVKQKASRRYHMKLVVLGELSFVMIGLIEFLEIIHYLKK